MNGQNLLVYKCILLFSVGYILQKLTFINKLLIIILASNAVEKRLYSRYHCLVLYFLSNNQNKHTDPIHNLKVEPESRKYSMKYCFFSASSSNRFSADQSYFSYHLHLPQPIFSSQELYILLESLRSKYDDAALGFFFSLEDNCVVKLLSPWLVVHLPCLALPCLTCAHSTSLRLSSPLFPSFLLSSGTKLAPCNCSLTPSDPIR